MANARPRRGQKTVVGIPKNHPQPRRGGRLSGSIEQVPLVEFDPMFLEQGDELVLERQTRMVLLLVLDVAAHRPYLRFADRKRGITSLPRKIGSLRKRLMNPLRRAAFDRPNRLGDRAISLETCEEMHMVGYPADLEQDAAFFAKDAAHVSIEAFAKRLTDERSAMFGC